VVKSPFVLEEIINNIPYFIFWKDRQSRYLGANRLFAESAGFKSGAEMVGLCDFDCCWSQEESEFFRKVDEEVMLKGDPVLNFEEPQRQQDGSTITLLTSKVPLKCDSGKVVGVMGIYTDITDRKNLEREKDKALEDLTRLQEIIIYQEKMTSLGEMAGGIAHEINNPLSIISASAQVIERVLDTGGDPQKILQSCDYIQKTVARCRDIINNLKDFSRLDVDTELEKTDLQDLLNSVLSMIDHSRKQKLTIEDFSRDSSFVMCKKISVEQALLNLLTNAFDATEDVQDGSIVIRPVAQDGRTGIEVLNRGEAISESVQKKMFQPFFTTKGVGKGTGLGLSTSQGLVENCGGQLTYARKADMNAFTITFDQIKSEERCRQQTG